jgi:hypothetical protein
MLRRVYRSGDPGRDQEGNRLWYKSLSYLHPNHLLIPVEQQILTSSSLNRSVSIMHFQNLIFALSLVAIGLAAPAEDNGLEITKSKTC